MPKLDTTLHLDMYRAGKRARSLPGRIVKALKVLSAKRDIYGLEWGDPETSPPYLRNMKALLKPASDVVIQYSDKSKPLGEINKSFSQNDPATMRRLVLSHGYCIREEDVGTLWHSSVIRFGILQ